jgi:hypothetical protein
MRHQVTNAFNSREFVRITPVSFDAAPHNVFRTRAELRNEEKDRAVLVVIQNRRGSDWSLGCRPLRGIAAAQGQPAMPRQCYVLFVERLDADGRLATSSTPIEKLKPLYEFTAKALLENLDREPVTPSAFDHLGPYWLVSKNGKAIHLGSRETM